MSITFGTAQEKGTLVITHAFTNEDENSVVPKTLFWALTDQNGVIINNRENVSITPATTVKIVLTGDDLAFQAEEAELDYAQRVLTIVGMYDRPNGIGLTYTQVITFPIENAWAAASVFEKAS